MQKIKGWGNTMNTENKVNVAILMATFNGERFIEEQINSICNQTFKDWTLYIRDDGSTDKTLSIINRFEKKDNRIHLISDNMKRLRPMKSFLTLLKEVEADFYFFCDQDDFWKKNKLELMMRQILNQNNKKPNLVYCNLQCVDSSLNPIDNNFNNLVGTVTSYSRCITNDMPGCVMLINKALRDLTNKYTTNYKEIMMHDWWIALIAQFCGKITFLNDRLILYRQHGDNAVGAGKNGSTLKKIFQKGIVKKQEKLVIQTYLQITDFFETYKNFISKKDIEVIERLISCRYKSILYRLNFLIKNNIHSTYGLRTFAYDILFCCRLNSLLKDKELRGD